MHVRTNNFGGTDYLVWDSRIVFGFNCYVPTLSAVNFDYFVINGDIQSSVVIVSTHCIAGPVSGLY
jgi:hypothetical protein